MRILWVSNSPWAPSGYGEQTALALPRIAALGHEVAVLSNYGISGQTVPWKGIPVFPGGGDWCNGTVSTFAKYFEADLVIALCDAWVLRPDKWPELSIAAWAPIDHFPIPPAVLAVLQHERVRPIAMSRDGEAWMRKFSLAPQYVPHAVDTSVFRPQPENRAAARYALQIPEDAFLVTMVAANKGNPAYPRKGFPQAFDAFATFATEHRDAYLYCHTQAPHREGHGIDLPTLARAVGIPEDRVAFPPDHAWDLGIMDSAFVAGVYVASDVLLNPSYGEGFGVPLIEAQACGVPVIASRHSAMTELTQAGWLVEGDRYWDALQASFGFIPSIGSIYRALEAAYEAREDAELRDAAVRFAQTYDADRVVERYWKPTIEELTKAREVGPLNGKPSRQVRRAMERKAAKA